MKEVKIREKLIEHKNEKLRLSTYAFDEAKEIDDSTVEKLSKIMFSFANAYPYLFDATCGLLTNLKKLAKKYKRKILKMDDIPEAIFYMIDIPFAELLHWALDGDISQKDRLIQDLINIAGDPPPRETMKYIPISQNYCARVAPIHLILFKKNEGTIPTSKLKRLRNLTIRKINKGTLDERTIILPERLPIERVQIFPLKLLFQDLMIGKYGERWFEVPKAFQAKIVSFRPEYIEKLSKDLGKLSREGKKGEKEYKELEKKIENFPSYMVLRRTYLYLKIHASSNRAAKTINITPDEFFAHVDPSYLKKNNYGKTYIDGGQYDWLSLLDTVHKFFVALEDKYHFYGEHLKPPTIGKTS
jgi:hypothetical protein